MPRRAPALLLAAVLLACGTSFAQQAGTPDARRRGEAAQKFFNKGSYDKALKEADAALSIDRDFPRALLLRSKALAAVFKKKYDTSSGLKNKPKVFSLLKQAAESLDRYLQVEPQAGDAAALRQNLEDLRAHGQLADDPNDSSRTVFRPNEATAKPRILRRPEPAFTQEAREAGTSGRVVLLAVLAADGLVKHPLVIRTVGQGLTESALDAAGLIKFTPAVKDGRPVSTVIQIEYNFNL